MFAVEIYAAVRRFIFVEGKSRREAAGACESSYVGVWRSSISNISGKDD
jgi:hypothetical protein